MGNSIQSIQAELKSPNPEVQAKALKWLGKHSREEADRIRILEAGAIPRLLELLATADPAPCGDPLEPTSLPEPLRPLRPLHPHSSSAASLPAAPTPQEGRELFRQRVAAVLCNLSVLPQGAQSLLEQGNRQLCFLITHGAEETLEATAEILYNILHHCPQEDVLRANVLQPMVYLLKRMVDMAVQDDHWRHASRSSAFPHCPERNATVFTLERVVQMIGRLVQAPKAVEQMSGLNCIPPLVTAVEHRHPAIARHAAQALGVMAQGDAGLRSDIIRRGGVRPLVTLLQRFDANPSSTIELLTQAAAAICNLAEDVQAQEQIREVVQPFHIIALTYNNDPRLLRFAAKGLSLLFQTEADLLQAVQCRGLRFLVMLLNSDGMEAVEYAVHCLAVLTNKLFNCDTCQQPIGPDRLRWHCHQCKVYDVCDACYQPLLHDKGHDMTAFPDFRLALMDITIPVVADPKLDETSPSLQRQVNGIAKLAELLANTLAGNVPSECNDQLALGALYTLVALADLARCQKPLMQALGSSLGVIGSRTFQNRLGVQSEISGEVRLLALLLMERLSLDPDNLSAFGAHNLLPLCIEAIRGTLGLRFGSSDALLDDCATFQHFVSGESEESLCPLPKKKLSFLGSAGFQAASPRDTATLLGRVSRDLTPVVERMRTGSRQASDDFVGASPTDPTSYGRQRPMSLSSKPCSTPPSTAVGRPQSYRPHLCSMDSSPRACDTGLEPSRSLDSEALPLAVELMTCLGTLADANGDPAIVTVKDGVPTLLLLLEHPDPFIFHLAVYCLMRLTDHGGEHLAIRLMDCNVLQRTISHLEFLMSSDAEGTLQRCASSVWGKQLWAMEATLPTCGVERSRSGPSASTSHEPLLDGSPEISPLDPDPDSLLTYGVTWRPPSSSSPRPPPLRPLNAAPEPPKQPNPEDTRKAAIEPTESPKDAPTNTTSEALHSQLLVCIRLLRYLQPYDTQGLLEASGTLTVLRKALREVPLSEDLRHVLCGTLARLAAAPATRSTVARLDLVTILERSSLLTSLETRRAVAQTVSALCGLLSTIQPAANTAKSQFFAPPMLDLDCAPDAHLLAFSRPVIDALLRTCQNLARQSLGNLSTECSIHSLQVLRQVSECLKRLAEDSTAKHRFGGSALATVVDLAGAGDATVQANAVACLRSLMVHGPLELGEPCASAHATQSQATLSDTSSSRSQSPTSSPTSKHSKWLHASQPPSPRHAYRRRPSVLSPTSLLNKPLPGLLTVKYMHDPMAPVLTLPFDVSYEQLRRELKHPDAVIQASDPELGTVSVCCQQELDDVRERHRNHADDHQFPPPLGLQAFVPGQPVASPLTPNNDVPRATSTGRHIRWTRGKYIGQGSYGKVYQALDVRTGEIMAIKVIPIRNEVMDPAKHAIEIEILQQYAHTNVVKYLGVQVIRRMLHIFMEFVPGGSIEDMLKAYGAFREPTIKAYTRQILNGLAYLHKNDIVHRDIKGGNILVTNQGVVKLADFGACLKLKEVSGSNQDIPAAGTIGFMAPEVIWGNYLSVASRLKSDVWSVGATVLQMYTMCTAQWCPYPEVLNRSPTPTPEEIAVRTYCRTFNGPPPEAPIWASAEGRRFLERCFQMNPELRDSAATLREHPFLFEGDVGDLSSKCLARRRHADEGEPADTTTQDTNTQSSNPVTRTSVSHSC